MLKEIQLIPVPNYDVCYGDYYLENNKLQQINVNHITGKIKFDKNKLNSIRFYGISNEEGTVDDEYAFLIDNNEFKRITIKRNSDQKITFHDIYEIKTVHQILSDLLKHVDEVIPIKLLWKIPIRFLKLKALIY